MRTSGAIRRVEIEVERATPWRFEASDGLDARVDEIAAKVDWSEALPPQAAGRSWAIRQAIKRVLDVVLATAALVVLFPALVVVAIIIRLDSTGGALYPWVVVGYRGRRFVGYKFRTMVSDADELKTTLEHLNEMTGPVFKIRDDPRITKVGRILRKFSIDEVPQLWSVIVGDMSLVGPRPLGLKEFVECAPEHRRKLSIQPGMTCLWQVSGRSAITSFEDWVRLDLEYIRNWSLILDFKILLRTIPVVLWGRNAY